MKKAFLILFGVFLMMSCSSDDDICISGEATPRVKLKFKDKNNKLIQLPQLFVDVDYGNGAKNVVTAKMVDSVLIPLKINGSGFTDLTVYTENNTGKSIVRINYAEESEYVSAACGIKRLYRAVKGELTDPEPVTGIEQVQTEITNENKTHFYLIF